MSKYLFSFWVTLFTDPDNIDMRIPILFFVYTYLRTRVTFYGRVHEKHGRCFHVGYILGRQLMSPYFLRFCITHLIDWQTLQFIRTVCL